MYPRKRNRPKVSLSEDDEQASELPTEGVACGVETDAIGYQGSGLLQTDFDGNHQSRSMFASTPLEYEISSPIQGTAVIIDENKFLDKDVPDRKGSTEDTKSLHATFQLMGFKSILTLTNVTRDEILTKLESVAKEPDSDIFLCVIMSHGDEGIIYGVDQPVMLDELLDLVSEEKCPVLAKKPKIFIIQACRGGLLDEGVEVQYEECCFQNDTPATSGREAVGDANQIKLITPYNSPRKLRHDIGDMLVARSTLCKHYSFRNLIKGSWFIQALCERLQSMQETEHLLSILTQVNRIVATEHESCSTVNTKFDKKKQMPVFSSTLSKLLYFKRNH